MYTINKFVAILDEILPCKP